MTQTPRRIIGIFLLGAVIALAGIVTYRYRQDIGEARQRIASGSQIAQTSCGPIQYADHGKGPPVLVVHGAGGGFDQGLDFGLPLTERGLRVIAMSRFGYLRTPLPVDASAEAQADAHACLLDALGIPRAAIIGASAGAPSSLQFALRHPQRTSALVLMVPAVYVPRPGDAAAVTVPPGTEFMIDTALRWDFLFWAAIRLAPRSVQRSLLATDPALIASASADEQARVTTMMNHLLPVSPRRLGLLNDGRITTTIERYPLNRITTPTLAISTADDLFGTYDSARYTSEQIPGARFIGYPGGGHLWVGRHQAVMTEITNFLTAMR
jgi:2-hydroxy-6-oxonona-2,4-dienedioate hydrolase